MSRHYDAAWEKQKISNPRDTAKDQLTVEVALRLFILALGARFCVSLQTGKQYLKLLAVARSPSSGWMFAHSSERIVKKNSLRRGQRGRGPPVK